MRIAIIVSEFNGEVTSRMLSVAQEKAESLGLTVACISRVPGAYDMPLIADALLGRSDVDGIVTLGAIIRGQTKHDEVIAASAAKSLTEVSLQHKKPISLGISGPGMHARQAYARIRPVSERAVEAVAKMSLELEKAKRQ